MSIETFKYLFDQDRSVTIYRSKSPFKLADSFAFLAGQSEYPQFFWKDKETHHYLLAIGSILDFDHIPSLTSSKREGPRLYGSLPFFQEEAHACFFLPKIEIVLNQEGEGFLFINSLDKEIKTPDFQKMASLTEGDFSYLERIDTPNYETWETLVQKALEAIHCDALKKVVLARSTHLKLEANISPLALLKELSLNTKNTTLFAHLFSAHEGFIGASPENLYVREDRKISTIALAGTAKLESAFSSKEEEECEHVVRFLDEKLKELCASYTKANSYKSLKMSYLQHLYVPFEGELKAEIQDRDIIEILHPTPAVGGRPREKALNFLKEHEPIIRGFYAAPTGWIAPDRAHLIVAIRSAFIHKSTILIYAGLGIVKDSDPKLEWAELELKIQPLLKLCQPTAKLTS